MNTPQTSIPLTRKQALTEAIRLLQQDPGQAKVIEKLKEIANNRPQVKWTEETARDAIESFMMRERRVPTVTDLRDDDCLPAHPMFRHYFKTTASEWLSKNYPSYFDPEATRYSALKVAYEVLSNSKEKQSKIKEILDEYPLTKWTVANVSDLLYTFWNENGRIPSKNDFKESHILPYDQIFWYQWKLPYFEWLAKYCPILKMKDEEQHAPRDYIAEFAAEYKKIKPRGEDDFNARRDKTKCCVSDYIILRTGCTDWIDLLDKAGVESYDYESEKIRKEWAKIKSVTYIVI